MTISERFKFSQHLLVETTKIEYASFPLKTALSEANDQTNGMTTTNQAYIKEWSFAVTTFFLENLF